jgi:hypothetical protein
MTTERGGLVVITSALHGEVSCSILSLESHCNNYREVLSSQSQQNAQPISSAFLRKWLVANNHIVTIYSDCAGYGSRAN